MTEVQTPALKPARPIFLSIICFLSILSNLVYVVINMLLLMRGNAIHWILTIPVLDVITEESLHGNLYYYMLNLALHSFCIYAVVLIFVINRKGFYYYVVAQSVLLILPFLFLSSLGYSYLWLSFFVTLIFTLFYIGLFSIYLPRLVSKKNP